MPPTNCWRCGAPLYPGYPICANCGLDLTPWMPSLQKRRSRLPLVVAAVLTVAVLATAGALVVTNRSKNWNPGGEPSPSDTWYAFTCPDGSWSVTFPGSPSPRTMTQTMDTGFGTMNMTVYVTNAGGVAYEAAAIDAPSAALGGGDTETVYTQFEQGIFLATGGEITNSRDLTFKGYQAREIQFTGVTTMKMEGYGRFWLVGQRMYMLMVVANPGTTMYPEHFFDSFTVN